MDWVKAAGAEYAYTTPGRIDWADDPVAMALTDASDAAYWRMARTTPTTTGGLALMIRAYLFEQFGRDECDARFNDANTWAWDSLSLWKDQRDRMLVETVLGRRYEQAWSAPSELVHRYV